jgi:hypothetical protein
MLIERKRLLRLPLLLTLLLLLLCQSSLAYKKKQKGTAAAAAAASAAAAAENNDSSPPEEETCVVGNDGVCLNNVPPLAGVEDDGVVVPYGEKQNVVGESTNDMKERLKRIHQYMYETVYPTLGEVGPHCKLNHKGSFYTYRQSLIVFISTRHGILLAFRFHH